MNAGHPRSESFFVQTTAPQPSNESKSPIEPPACINCNPPILSHLLRRSSSSPSHKHNQIIPPLNRCPDLLVQQEDCSRTVSCPQKIAYYDLPRTCCWSSATSSANGGTTIILPLRSPLVPAALGVIPPLRSRPRHRLPSARPLWTPFPLLPTYRLVSCPTHPLRPTK